MYEVAILVMMGAAILCSLFFLVTWVPAALRARRKGVLRLSFWGIMDFVGLPALILVSMTLTAYTAILRGFLPDQPWTFTASRLLTVGTLTVLAAIRTMRWVTTWVTSDDVTEDVSDTHRS